MKIKFKNANSKNHSYTIFFVLSILGMLSSNTIHQTKFATFVDDKINIMKANMFYFDFHSKQQEDLTDIDRKLSEAKILAKNISHDINELELLKDTMISPDYESLHFDIMKFFVNRSQFINSEIILILPKHLREIG